MGSEPEKCEVPTKNKEQIYAEEIRPLTNQIFQICEAHGIASLMVFELSSTGGRISVTLDENGCISQNLKEAAEIFKKW